MLSAEETERKRNKDELEELHKKRLDLLEKIRRLKELMKRFGEG